MTPVEWAMRPLKKYAQFSGRAPRAEYWWFNLFLMIGYVVAMLVDRLIGSKVLGPYGLFAGLLWLAVIVPTIAVGVRRLHDTNRTGWWMLGPIIPYLVGFVLILPTMKNPENPPALASAGGAGILMLVGMIMAIVIFIFTVLPGTKGTNKYGADPYGADVEQVFA